MSNTAILSIYQLKEDKNTEDLRYLKFSKLSDYDLKPEHNLYNLVYSNRFSTDNPLIDSLDSIFEKFNSDIKPAGFYKRSLSVSDVIVIEKENHISAHYVDNIDFVELPEFAKDHMFQMSDFRDEPVYKLCATDVFDVMQDLNLLEDLTQDEMREIVQEARSEISLDWHCAIQSVIENYIAHRDYEKKRGR